MCLRPKIKMPEVKVPPVVQAPVPPPPNPSAQAPISGTRVRMMQNRGTRRGKSSLTIPPTPSAAAGIGY